LHCFSDFVCVCVCVCEKESVRACNFALFFRFAWQG
jgi:hypothetical protein